MSDGSAPAVSIFHAVDQAAMFERIAESPREDAEVGFLSDRDAEGNREFAPSLLDGIRIFSGTSTSADESHSTVAAQPVDPQPDAPKANAASPASFILFGPGGQGASSS